MSSLRNSTIALLSRSAVCVALLHGVARGQDAEDSLPYFYHAQEQLKKQSLPPEERTKILLTLVEMLGGADESNILFLLGQQMRNDARARELVLPRFAELLRSGREDRVRGGSNDLRLCRLIDTLLSAGDAPPESVAQLEAVLNDAKSFPFAAPKAAAMLLRLDPKRRDARRALGDWLQSKRSAERLRAAAALGPVGKPAEPMVAGLRPLLEDEAVEVRVMAANSLWRIDPRSPNVVGALRNSLRAEPASVILRPFYLSEWLPNHRHLAVQYLGQMGESAREAAGDVTALLKSPDETLRMLAAQSLGTIGARTPDVISALERAKADSNVAVAKSAERSLELLKSGKAASPK